MPRVETLPQKNTFFRLVPSRRTSRLSEIKEEAARLADFDPSILSKIDADRDKFSLEKKRVRILNKEWEDGHGSTPLFGAGISDGALKELTLQNGRPRLPSLVVLTLSMVRGWLGGAKDKVVQTMLEESISIEILCHEHGINMPGPSTITENCNMISSETQSHALKALLRMAQEEGLDDYFDVAFDSTAVKSSSAFPTDSSVIANLVRRGRRGLILLANFGLTVPVAIGTELKIEEVSNLEKKIALIGKGKGRKRKRKRLYKKLYARSRVAAKYLNRALARLEPMRGGIDERPSIIDKIDAIILSIKDDLADVEKAVAASEERTQHDGKVKPKDKVLSVSDESAAMIVKGGRETILGYKPQLGRSSTGLITAFIVGEGNASDSSQMVPIVLSHQRNTGVVPRTITFDDGYASAEGLEACNSVEGIEAVSISGAKGKKLIPDYKYESLEYEGLRNIRSTVESTIGHLKGSNGFGACRRVGIEAVRSELTEKILSFNLVRIARLRAAKAESQAAA